MTDRMRFLPGHDGRAKTKMQQLLTASPVQLLQTTSALLGPRCSVRKWKGKVKSREGGVYRGQEVSTGMSLLEGWYVIEMCE